VTPLAWVLLVVFLLLQGGIFYNIVSHFSNLTDLSLDAGPLQAYFGQQSVLVSMTLLILCPALTMRLFAEERRSNTIETLLTTTITPAAAVLGKYLATLSTYSVIWMPTVLYAIILRSTGSVDFGVVLSSYLGLFISGASYLGVGLLMSTLTRSQLVALMLTVMLQFGLFVLSIGEYVFEAGALRELCAHVSLTGQMEEFSRGVVDLRRLVFHGSLAAVALIYATRVVGGWRWD
jgi:ABC-2 type transport system permease protein